MLRAFLCSILLLVGSTAAAGAWDVGAFDNDDALDWIIEATEASNIGPVRDALERVVNGPGYIQVTEANRALAAAEVVAALNGNANPMLPDELDAWIDANDLETDTELTMLAKHAVLLVLDLKTSELAQLWADAPQMSEVWNAEMAELSSRLD